MCDLEWGLLWLLLARMAWWCRAGSRWALPIHLVIIIMLTASSGKRNVTVWRPSVCLFRRHTHRDSTGGSIRRGQRTFRPNNKEDRHTCYWCNRWNTWRCRCNCRCTIRGWRFRGGVRLPRLCDWLSRSLRAETHSGSAAPSRTSRLCALFRLAHGHRQQPLPR